MQLDLKRVDLGSTGAAERNSLQVLPIRAEPGQGQRVVVGDTAGVLQSFHFKGNSLVQVFKGVPGARKINCVACGLATTQRDKTYVAEGSVIKGYDIKGTQFFRFTTPLTEDITSLAVAGSVLFTFTSSSVTIFEETQERCTYIAPEAITASAVVPLLSAETWWPLIGCNDRSIKVLNNDRVAQEVPLPAIPTALTYVTLSHDVFNKHPARKEVWCGLSSGDLLQLFLDASTAHRGTTLAAADSGKTAAITQVHPGFDSAQDGLDDIVVGREDGSIEIYHMDSRGRLMKCWEASVRQSISSIDSGHITGAAHDEYIVHTYGGAVLAFTAGPNPHVALPAAAVAADEPDTCTAKQREIDAAKQELKALDAELQAKRAKLTAKSAAMVAQNQLLPLKHHLRLDQARAVYELSLEATVPVFCVAVLATVAVTFLEAPDSAAILSVCDTPAGASTVKLATYRCHDSMSRLVVLMRIPEGQAGSVSAYVVARAAPRTSAAVTYPVHTLCMHHRVHTPDSGRTYGHVDVSGDFRAQEMHAWVANVLPDMPRQSADEETRLAYRSSALDTHVIASFRNGTARFASDSAAALAMLRAELTRHANDSQVRVRVATSLDKAVVVAFVRRLWQPLQALRQWRHEELLRTGVGHLKAVEGEATFLTDRMKAIMGDGTEAQARREGGEGVGDLDNLVQQLVVTQAEWMRQQGRTPTVQDVERLERTAHDRRSTLAQLTQLVAPEG